MPGSTTELSGLPAALAVAQPDMHAPENAVRVSSLLTSVVEGNALVEEHPGRIQYAERQAPFFVVALDLGDDSGSADLTVFTAGSAEGDVVHDVSYLGITNLDIVHISHRVS